jgi:hypothetical protein
MSSNGSLKSKREITNRYPPNKPNTCYVNPVNPADAVLNRDFTPTMLIGLFPLLFIVIGIVGIKWASTTKRFAPLPVPADGAAPWQQRPDWAAGRIVSSTKSTMKFLWGFAAAWNAMSWIAVGVFLASDEQKHPLAYAIFLFPSVGLLLLWLAWKPVCSPPSASPQGGHDLPVLAHIASDFGLNETSTPFSLSPTFRRTCHERYLHRRS